VDVVFDQRHLVPLGDLHDRLTTAQRHGAAGGIVERGQAVERPRGSLAAGGLEGLGYEPSAVERRGTAVGGTAILGGVSLALVSLALWNGGRRS
jgi:hypothetical protein